MAEEQRDEKGAMFRPAQCLSPPPPPPPPSPLLKHHPILLSLSSCLFSQKVAHEKCSCYVAWRQQAGAEGQGRQAGTRNNERYVRPVMFFLPVGREVVGKETAAASSKVRAKAVSMPMPCPVSTPPQNTETTHVLPFSLKCCHQQCCSTKVSEGEEKVVC